MSLAWTLRVQIEDGCNFDFGFHKNQSIGGFFRCIFNQCINQSSIIRIPTFLSYDIQPIWNEALEWQFDDKTLKKLKKYGSSIKLQLFIIKNWNENTMATFPINNFNKNKQKYNIQQIGYIVLDLKNAISNGTKITNFDHPEIDSKYLRIRNVKMAKNNGIHPQIKVSFWCALQPKWADNDKIIESSTSPQVAEQQQLDINTVSKEVEIDNNVNNKKREIIVINEKNANNINNDDNITPIIGNKWYCVIHKMEVFVDIPIIRLLIVSMNDRYILNLPLDEINVINNEFSNDYPNFSWYLQSSINNKTTTNEWNTIASYSCNIHQFISNNHSKTFILKLNGGYNKCIAKATISVSWESYSHSNNKKVKKIINITQNQEKQEEIKKNVESSRNSEYSSFSADIDNLVNDENDDENENENENEEERKDKDEYIAFNILNDKTMDNDGNDIDNVGIGINDECNYKYRIGIDIRSIRDLRDSYNIQCKYKYILFDNNRIFMSNPPILINKYEEKAINDGFCAYEIILKSKELYQNLYKYPLIIINYTMYS